ncbi:MAG: phosphoribosylformylglycinamidine synthase subunit PurL, partial [Alphaproteobacteria bacterium]|nr:phosphoribosylformylglycinamidine synthase subunit PurL [Alphaproteobacteria bacterium]
MSAITPELVAEHGLSAEEYGRIVDLLGRPPNLVELGVFSVMWSEHCSYKSTRVHLRRLPTKAAWVIQGPGENAGVVDIGDGDAAVFKMESHNHPSFIEPYQGAATGVGGIMRDVFTMGARPIAMLNALRFGAPEHPKTRHLVSGVVAGIGGYGNCMGVPTVGGEVNFHASYNGNILVNAMCVGLARTDKIFLSAAKGSGNPVVYIGSKTGRDGIHGATMASAEFSEDAQEKRPTVQVGDPFTEKLLLEACLELMATDAIIAIQDMGAAGLTSSSAEMADKGGSGIELDLDKVPQREAAMSAYEMMLSESQERMLAVLKPGREKQAEAIFAKWELDFAVIGVTTDTDRLVVRHKGEVVADLPVRALSNEAPLYERPFQRRPPQSGVPGYDRARALDASLLRLIGSADLCARRWIWEQYDHTVMNDTVQRPGGDAAVVRVHGSQKGLAMSTDVTPRYCFADPFEGGKQAVAEACRNLSAVGARPLAATDNLNFGNPQKPEIMWQIVAAIDGIAEACRVLDCPIVSGNCSLYNETNGEGILPTPAIGTIGLIANVSRMASIAFKRSGDILLLLGHTRGHLGQSLYLREIEGRQEGAAPPVDLDAERSHGAFVRELIETGRVDSCHDVADGGLLVAISEMALAGNMGV